MDDKKVTKAHIQKHAVIEYEIIPEHEQREDTATFRHAKKIEKAEGIGCFICGTHEHTESHHVLERCFANALDMKKVAHFLYNFADYHGHCHRDFKSVDELYSYLCKFEPSEALDCLYNQLVLCATHHRGEGEGIHGTSTPTWFAIMNAKDGADISMSEAEFKNQH